jgi:putative phosphonate metabolism protein
MQQASRDDRGMMDGGPRYAIYFVPAAGSDLYRFGSSVLRYDCYTGEQVDPPAQLAADTERWRSLTEEPRRYGFHATLKAPFHLTADHAETALMEAVRSFADSGRVIPTITPAVDILSGFAALVPRHRDASVEALAAQCTTEFDRFRAPMSLRERARRLAAPLSPEQVENLDRWGYPYVLGQFRFHMTLSGPLPAHMQQATLATLRGSFERQCGSRPIAIDRLTLLKQDAPENPFRVLSQAQLSAAC